MKLLAKTDYRFNKENTMTIKNLYEWAVRNNCVDANFHLKADMTWYEPTDVTEEEPFFVTIGIKEYKPGEKG